MPIKIVGTKGSAMFIHIPKTGGTTITKWIWKHHYENLMRLNGHQLGHIPSKYVDHSFKFGFVRNPIAWWESVWKMLRWMDFQELMHKGFQPLAIVHPLIDKDFNVFMDQVLNRIPGFYCQMLEIYCNELDYIGRTSRLERDFIEVLDLIGFTYDVDTVLNWKNWGVRRNSIIWRDDLKDQVLVEEAGWEKWVLR